MPVNGESRVDMDGAHSRSNTHLVDFTLAMGMAVSGETARSPIGETYLVGKNSERCYPIVTGLCEIKDMEALVEGVPMDRRRVLLVLGGGGDTVEEAPPRRREASRRKKHCTV